MTDLCSEKECSCPSTISDNLMEIVDSLETENYCLKIDFKRYMYNCDLIWEKEPLLYGQKK